MFSAATVAATIERARAHALPGREAVSVSEVMASAARRLRIERRAGAPVYGVANDITVVPLAAEVVEATIRKSRF